MPKSILQRLRASLAREGVRGAAARLHRFLLEYWFDIRNGVDTRKPADLFRLQVRGENLASGTRYAPTRVSVLRALFAALADLIPPQSVLLDIGCGKGRALLLAAEAGFREARGVEFAHELCEVAIRNCARYAKRTRTATRFFVEECDAAAYSIREDENVFFLFNPFSEDMVEKVLDHIEASVREHPRMALVLYVNPTCAGVFQKRPDFALARDLDYWDVRCAIYQHAPAGAPAEPRC